MCELPGRGIHPVFLRYALEMYRRGVDVCVGTSEKQYEDGCLSELADHDMRTARIEAFFNPTSSFMTAARSLASWLSLNTVDLIHCQGFSEMVRTQIACRMARKLCPIVMVDRNSVSWQGFSLIARVLALRIFRPKVIVLSGPHAKRIASLTRGIINPSYIPNGVDTKVFFPRVNSLGVGTNRDSRTLIYPGAFTEKKNHLGLVRICENLSRQGERFRIILAGDGPTEAQIKEVVSNSSWSSSVEFTEWVPWRFLPEIYSRASIGVFPSLSEMMPNAILEMMAMGLPVVAYGVGGIPHILGEDDCGYTISPGDEQAFTDKVRLLLNDAELSLKYGVNARKRVEMLFSVEAVVKELLSLYSQILN
jgi:glycosyltransferase involved in cell wall biosynthesis